MGTLNIFSDNEYYFSTQQFIKKNKNLNKVVKDYKTKLYKLCKSSHFINLYQTAQECFLTKEKTHDETYSLINNIIIKFIKSIKDSPITNDDLSTRFISKQIKNDIYSSIQDKKVFEDRLKLKIQNVHFNIHCFRGGAIQKINIDKLYSFLKLVVPFLLHYSNTSHSRDNTNNCVNNIIYIDMFFVLTRHSKTFNIDYDDSLTSANINSGVTHHQGKRKRIIIYRYEECFKVLLHELIHALGLDMGSLCDIQEPKIKKLLTTIRNEFNLHADYNNGLFLIEEACTEIWTSFIYTLFYSLERSHKQGNVIKLFTKRYSQEYIYSLIKINNIIKYNTLLVDVFNNDLITYSTSLNNVFRILMKNSNRHSQNGHMLLFNKKTQYTDTSLIEYYIIKTLFMTNIIQLFSLREHYINPINTYCSQEQIYNILLLLKSHTKNISEFSNIYDIVDKSVQNNVNNKNENKEDIQKLFNTLCMTTFF